MRIIFYGWEKENHPILFYKMLADKTNMTLTEAHNIRIMIGTQDVEIYIKNQHIANEVIKLSVEYGVLVRVESE